MTAFATTCHDGAAGPLSRTDAARFDAVYAGASQFLGIFDAGVVPWEIAAPQPAVVELGDAGLITGTVLDIGCGSGDNAIYLAGLGLDVVGVDVSPVAIAMAEAKASGRGLPIGFVAADASAIGAWPARFDTC